MAKVKCPNSDCLYEVEVSKDAIVALRNHVKEAHGMDDIPADLRRRIESNIKEDADKR
jgi:predicted small metal-binding protein